MKLAKQIQKWISKRCSNILSPTATTSVNEVELITLENIGYVLEYNGVDRYSVRVYADCIIIEDCLMEIPFDNKNWLQHIEVEFGKLKPLPKLSRSIKTTI